MSVSFNFGGGREVARNLKRLEKEAEKSVHKGLDEFGLDILDKSNKIVPFDTGELENAIIDEPARGFSKTIGYDTPYAAKQHEDTSLIHPGPQSTSPGRGAKGEPKYLERPLRENAGDLVTAIARQVKRSL